MNFIFVPMILFIVIVAPIWIVMHYLSVRRSGQGLNDQDRLVIEDMLKTVDRLSSRIESLEHILDAESPSWKSQD